MLLLSMQCATTIALLPLRWPRLVSLGLSLARVVNFDGSYVSLHGVLAQPGYHTALWTQLALPLAACGFYYVRYKLGLYRMGGAHLVSWGRLMVASSLCFAHLGHHTCLIRALQSVPCAPTGGGEASVMYYAPTVACSSSEPGSTTRRLGCAISPPPPPWRE